MIAVHDTDSLIAAYVDGELDAAQVAEVERLIATRPDLQRVIAVHRETTSLLRAACAESFYPNRPTPMMRTPPRRASYWNPRWAAAAAVAAMIGFGGGAAWMNAPEDRREHLLTEVAEYHEVFAKETRHLVEIPADRMDELTEWLSGRIGRKVEAPNLESRGLRLAGGRLLVIDGRPVAELMYTRDNAGPVALCISEIDGKPSANPGTIRLDRRGEFTLASWEQGAYSFVMVGNVANGQMRDAAESAKRQTAG
jgi:anti-sigma factor RsiW